MQDRRSPLESFTADNGFAPRDTATPRDGFTAYDPVNFRAGSHDYTGRHVGPRGKTARKRAGKAVPAAAAAATLAVGAAAYFLFGGTSQPQASQLNAAMGISGAAAGSTASASAGNANGAAAAIIKATTAAGPGASKAKHAKATTKAKPPVSRPATRPAAPAPAAPAPAAAAPAAATKQAAAPAASAAATKPASSATLSCNLSGGLLPENVTAIVSFLLAHGYSDNAAAGIAGNMYQESKGNPESEGMGGGGLIGWTPLPAGFVTGNVTADLDTQLSALLTYNQGWAQYIPELDSASSPADAAYIYVTDFERAGIPAASTREAAATDVASACGI
jgi:Phage tail lysozyme